MCTGSSSGISIWLIVHDQSVWESLGINVGLKSHHLYAIVIHLDGCLLAPTNTLSAKSPSCASKKLASTDDLGSHVESVA